MIMIIDYSERNQSRRNPPRRSTSSLTPLLIVLFLVLIIFCGGVWAGWYLFHPGGRFSKPVVAQVQPIQNNAQKIDKKQPKPQQQETNKTANGTNGKDQNQNKQQNGSDDTTNGQPPLTFYNTLEKGSKQLMGTGLNPTKPAAPPEPAKEKPE